MTNKEIVALFIKFDAGTISESELDQFYTWCSSCSLDDFNRALEEVSPGERVPMPAHRKAALEQALDEVTSKERSRIYAMPRWGWAAAVLLLFSLGTWWMVKIKPSPLPAIVATTITPGKNGAILQLANGEKVVLDSMGNGLVAQQNGTKVLLQNGQLSYDAAAASNSTIAWNTMSTPKGRQFKIVLPDGSRAWLNAASSIRFPTVFAGNMRQVDITGEVYFEVAANASQPFRVNTPGNTTIDVLGTDFNVNAYTDEDCVNATLMAGSVKVSKNNFSALLKPGEQARVSSDAHIRTITAIDTEKVMAWKNGRFDFEDAGLKEVMRQLERWYDIEVVYEKNIPDIHFGGKLSMDMSLQGVLLTLQDTGVHFRLEGRKLIVMP
jgi:ferric-dicitrate binding protein FerR (iron transport regulator)